MSDLVPKPGDWAVFYDGDSSYRLFAVEAKKVVTVTPKLVKFDGSRYPRQTPRDRLITLLPDEQQALFLVQAIDGAAGEFQRRDLAASREYNERRAAAETATREAIAKLVSKALGDQT